MNRRDLFAGGIRDNLGDDIFSPFHLIDHFALAGGNLTQFFEAEATQRSTYLIKGGIGMDGTQTFLRDA